MEANIINLMIFFTALCIWIILAVNHNFKWYTHILAGIWGFFLGQTIIGICGQNTLISWIINNYGVF